MSKSRITNCCKHRCPLLTVVDPSFYRALMLPHIQFNRKKGECVCVKTEAGFGHLILIRFLLITNKIPIPNKTYIGLKMFCETQPVSQPLFHLRRFTHFLEMYWGRAGLLTIISSRLTRLSFFCRLDCWQ